LIEWWNGKQKKLQQKGQGKKIKNKDKIKKQNIWENCNWRTKLNKIFFDWMMKLKAKKASTKGSRKKN
jgi:hypothetical protein